MGKEFSSSPAARHWLVSAALCNCNEFLGENLLGLQTTTALSLLSSLCLCVSSKREFVSLRENLRELSFAALSLSLCLEN
jgi:hypothetical protein